METFLIGLAFLLAMYRLKKENSTRIEIPPKPIQRMIFDLMAKNKK